MATRISTESVSIFQQARNAIDKDVNEIIQSLNKKKFDLFAEINTLEKEFADQKQQKQKKINKLHALISQTEELGENSLLHLQQKIIHDIQQEVKKLNLDYNQGPSYNICVNWRIPKENLILNIRSNSIGITVEKLPNLEEIMSSTAAENIDAGEERNGFHQYGDEGGVMTHPDELNEKLLSTSQIEQISRSILVLEVKPYTSETGFRKLDRLVRDVEMDGLTWGSSYPISITYGISKLRISAVICDELVSADLLCELIESNEDHIQSTEILSFQKYN